MNTTPIDVTTLDPKQIDTIVAEKVEHLPKWLNKDCLAQALHEKMAPYNDTLEDVHKALNYALNIDPSKDGGFVVIASHDKTLLGAVVMMKTGMDGYIPPWILLMVYVDPGLRGKGIGKQIINMAMERTDGHVKLHVEHDNPARRLYERLGFTSKYLEMRYQRP